MDGTVVNGSFKIYAPSWYPLPVIIELTFLLLDTYDGNS